MGTRCRSDQKDAEDPPADGLDGRVIRRPCQPSGALIRHAAPGDKGSLDEEGTNDSKFHRHEERYIAHACCNTRCGREGHRRAEQREQDHPWAAQKGAPPLFICRETTGAEQRPDQEELPHALVSGGSDDCCTQGENAGHCAVQGDGRQ